MKKAFIEMRCDAPGCDSKKILPLGKDGQVIISSKEDLQELDRWHGLLRNDGSTFDYCRPTCLVNGAKLLNPVDRIPASPTPDPSPIVSATGEPLSREGGLIIPS